MNEKVRKLINILEDEIALHESSLDLLSREKEAMAKYSSGDLIECQKIRKKLNLRSRKLEGARKMVLLQISEDMGIPYESLTLSALSGEVDEKDGEDIERCRKSLQCLTEDIANKNRRNREIAGSSLSFINHLIEILSGSGASAANYLSSGAMEKRGYVGNRMRVEA